MAANLDTASAEKFMDTVRTVLSNRGMNVVIGFGILIIGHLFGILIKTIIQNAGERRANLFAKREKTVESNRNIPASVTNISLVYSTTATLSYWFIMAIALLTVLRVLGVETASVITVLAAAGFAIGLAIQGTLSDISAGIVLAVTQHFAIGDIIQVQGTTGFVRQFTLLSTIVEDLNTRSYVNIPNRHVQEGLIRNETRLSKRVAMFDIKVSNKNKDFLKIVQWIKDFLQSYEGVLADPEVVVGVVDMSQAGTTIRARPWILSKDFPGRILPMQSAVRQHLSNMGVIMPDPIQ